MKKILITGASGGIGSSIADKFLKNKYEMILTSSSEVTLSNLKKKYGKNHHYYVLNFINPDENNIILKKISEEHQDLDVIVNNAGITDDSLLLRMKTDQWNNVIQANLSSNFTIIKALLPNMIRNKSGNIIGVSSVVATSGNPGQSNYVAAKSGMIGFYKSIALEVASRNINVNVVSPGFIISPMTNKLNDNQKNVILEKIPMKRFGEANEIADLVYFLSSDDSKYITGQNIHINGGMLMV
ncbi:MAG: 3-oxoacyl-ACP reductase FabG [Proteobacteria bacterium]|nr:3-oxoacyl-ACP reductase FabG [Alphaproteobacteria bacterium]MDA0968273.1 3-oxoacyl-ACP reductase FabG [Pseudomonadota bacterium]MDA1181734.1 3-oxoacyl-ACP reductase FabG [Pseudomonadota bacterium]